jgi:hypothetical protein
MNADEFRNFFVSLSSEPWWEPLYDKCWKYMSGSTVGSWLELWGQPKGKPHNYIKCAQKTL